MKKTILNLFAILFTFSKVFADEVIDNSIPPVPQNSNIWGTGAQATPIDEYSLVLILSGVLVATFIYLYKNKSQLKFK